MLFVAVFSVTVQLSQFTMWIPYSLWEVVTLLMIELLVYANRTPSLLCLKVRFSTVMLVEFTTARYPMAGYVDGLTEQSYSLIR